jgi:radical SAM superfamily enzyme YgiQ (UPF0313 family)
VRIVLVSTYDLGRQPFGLASPAAWLRGAGHAVSCADLAVGTLPLLEVREADLVAIHLPMHTATRLAPAVIGRVRQLNPEAHLCCFGLYAPVNEAFLRTLGVHTVLGGEFETALRDLAAGIPQERLISTARQQFMIPERSGLPVLARYPKLVTIEGKKVAGSTEASRGCKHLCRHCPIVPVYQGMFRIVQPDVVLADIRQQVKAGAQHISFGDPDFFNGPAHARRVVEQLHAEFPSLTYDVTIKIEHLLEHRSLLPVLKKTGCIFVISAVESIDDYVLAQLAKGHTRDDFFEAVQLMKEHGLALAPTFIPFHPWTTRDGFAELLAVLRELDLVDSVPPVQLSLRLLISAGSRLLELDDICKVTTGFDSEALVWQWRHSDSSVDDLSSQIVRLLHEGIRAGKSRRGIFADFWQAVHSQPLFENFDLLPRTTIPYMEEPWFC